MLFFAMHVGIISGVIKVTLALWFISDYHPTSNKFKFLNYHVHDQHAF